jgi:hypothetical protein
MTDKKMPTERTIANPECNLQVDESVGFDDGAIVEFFVGAIDGAVLRDVGFGEGAFVSILGSMNGGDSLLVGSEVGLGVGLGVNFAVGSNVGYAEGYDR